MSDGSCELRGDHLSMPLASRMPRVAGHDNERLHRLIMAAHTESLLAGDPVYVDPLTLRSVMTAAFLASRGKCCTSGCRHCPFEQ